MSALPPAPFSNLQYYNALCTASEFVVSRLGRADIAIVLGSGLNNFVARLTDIQRVPYHEIPFMPTTTVAGHCGEIVRGVCAGKTVFCFAGRVHGYEGYPSYNLTFIARLASFMGCKSLILTNASGGSLPGMKCGSIMIIKDHLNLTLRNPLEDTFEDLRFGPRHLDTSSCYSSRIASIAKNVASREGFELHEGIYCWTSGPTYETRSEVQLGIKLGAGAFGMSTVPEVLAAHALGMEVFAMALITNLACGLAEEVLTHEAVTVEANLAGPKMERLVMGIVHDMQPQESQVLSPASMKVHCTPLLKEEYPVPTFEEVSQAAYLVLSANLHHPRPQIAVYLSAGQEDALLHCTHVRQLAYTELPFMPRVSPSGRDGGLALGTLACGRRVLFLFGNYLEGLDPSESTFLTCVLLALGLQQVLVSLPAVALDGSSDSVRLVEDYHNFTREAPILVTDPKLLRLERDASSDRNLHRRLRQSGVTSECILMGVHGPTLPNQATMTACKRLSASAVTITSLSLLDACVRHKLDWACIIISSESSVGGMSSALKQSVAALNSLLCASIPQDFEHILAEGATPLAITAVGHGVAAPRQLQLPLQGRLDHVTEAAEFVRAKLGSAFSLATCSLALVVHDSMFGLLDKLFLPLSEVCIAEVPHYGQLLLKGELHNNASSCKFVFGKIQHSSGWRHALILVGSRRYLHNEPSAHLAFGPRVLSALGATLFCLVMPMESCVDSILPGQVVVVKDHINCTGQSVLTGRNVPEWGKRFSDMGEPYMASLRQALNSTGALREVVCMWLNCAKLANARAECALAAAGGAQTIAAVGIAEATAICHLEKRLCFAGIITRSLVNMTDADPAQIIVAGRRLQESIAELVSNACAGGS